MKKLVAIILTLCLMLSLCSFVLADDSRSFTDSTGRTVEVPATITRVAITGSLTQYVVFALAPEMLVAISTDWDNTAVNYLPEEYLHLTNIGQLYGGKGEMNLEQLLSVNPDVVIDVGEAKNTIVEDMDRLTAQTGIPFVHIDATLATFDTAFTMLGDLLGKQEEAAVLASYCSSTYARALEIAGSVEKVNLLYITGDEGLNVIANGSYHSEVIDLFSNNLAVVESPSSKGTGNEVDMEQIMKWNPDFVIFAPQSIFSTVSEYETWKNVTAIANNAYIEVPYGPQNWMGFPPSCQRFLGLVWMAKCLYPQAATYDLYEEIAQYYQLFYHCELTQEQYDALVANSVGKLAK